MGMRDVENREKQLKREDSGVNESIPFLGHGDATRSSSAPDKGVLTLRSSSSIGRGSHDWVRLPKYDRLAVIFAVIDHRDAQGRPPILGAQGSAVISAIENRKWIRASRILVFAVPSGTSSTSLTSR